MESNFDLEGFVKLINKIHDNYFELKKDYLNQELYYKLKDSLKELSDLIDNRLLPGDLYYKTEKFYYDVYRLMETKYKGKRERKK